MIAIYFPLKDPKIVQTASFLSHWTLELQPVSYLHGMHLEVPGKCHPRQSEQF